MSDPYVYRSRAPQVVDAWKQGGAKIQSYIAATSSVLEAAGLGSYQVFRHTSGRSPGKFAGLAIPEGAEVPDGWRMGSGYAVPDKRTKAGKDIAAALAACKHPGDPLMDLPGGMPPDILVGGGFQTPAVRLLEDGAALYVAWRVDPAGVRESFQRGPFEIDRDLWEGPVKLSEYYTAVEAADSQQETAGAS